MNRIKLPIRERLGNVPQFSVGVDVVVAEIDPVMLVKLDVLGCCGFVFCQRLSGAWQRVSDTRDALQLADFIDIISSALSLRSILDANKLTGLNFADWLRNLRIVLKSEKMGYILNSPFPKAPDDDATCQEHQEYHNWIDEANVAQCIILASMNPELQKQHEHMDAYTILVHLQELYDVEGRTARYEISKELFRCKMAEGTSVNDHVLKMINLIESLGQLGFAMDGELSQDLVLQSLPDSFSQFFVNFHMNKMDVSLPELHNMLKTAESNFPSKKSSVLLIGEGSTSKKRKRTFPKKKKKIGESKPTPAKAKVDPKSNVV
ncbi:hypothetical protein AgCh_003285 [Apium graveolens]